MSIGSNAPNALFYKARAERGDVETRRFQGEHERIRKIVQQTRVVLGVSGSGRNMFSMLLSRRGVVVECEYAAINKLSKAGKVGGSGPRRDRGVGRK
ncbi:hypothetical protein N7471_013099 [Penicillium samsonianum]|uniref:uncharacterized protein n=1 Tax=Penicillium samsonianum TaxID=1882272 RepID=UPI0025471ADE|nr:uncharacterized protein N7471_013099 [Penicillium samsonianum]KAJ6118479.1 hypothetical protein N7471_013099 [Penicillium samsonianum]